MNFRRGFPLPRYWTDYFFLFLQISRLLIGVQLRANSLLTRYVYHVYHVCVLDKHDDQVDAFGGFGKGCQCVGFTNA